MEGRCETCRHWDWNADSPYRPNDTGWCKRTAHNGSYPEDRDSLAWCHSMEESDCQLSTHRTFGCVQWEPK